MMTAHRGSPALARWQSPRLALLFWCYKDTALCANRVAWLRCFNPDVPLFVVYGGPGGQARQSFERALGHLVDDFYAFDHTAHPIWRWLNGDLILVEWFRARGQHLRWDTVVVVQWDMIIGAPVQTLFGDLGIDEVLLSGLRPIRDMEQWWGWVSRRPGTFRQEYEEFVDAVRRRFGFDGDPMGCIFIVVCLPRTFMARLAEEHVDEGFIEYRVPILAQAFGFRFARDMRFRPWSPQDPDSRGLRGFRRRALNGVGLEVSKIRLACELLLPHGHRIFHPVHWIVPAHHPSLLASVVTACFH